jgi:parallel beta-helix repeat protein
MRHKHVRPALVWSATLGLGVSVAAAAMAAPAMASTSVHAGSSRSVVFVSTHGRAGARDTSCSSARFKSIRAAVSSVARGGRVEVCAGRYHEDVLISKGVSLQGHRGAVINAAHRFNGVLVLASRATVSGLTVMNATGEGILVRSANHVTIERNDVMRNDRGTVPPHPVKTSYAQCKTVGHAPGDCGEGIHLMGSSFSIVRGNVSTGNSGGILLSDETGPTAHNQITGNKVIRNLFDCGITVVSHNPKAAPKGRPAPRTAGVYRNLIAGNTLTGNGTKGDGAGVVLATGVPGGAVYDNTVTRNSINGNGLSGVTVHSHTPGQFLNGNVITRNTIGTNNVDGDSDFAPHVDHRTTGVLVATVAPLSITVSRNHVAHDHFGIWHTGPATVHHPNNSFSGVSIHLARG